MRSYRPEELFDATGARWPELRRLPPRGDRRMSANPHTNGGMLLRDLVLPDFREYAVPCTGRASAGRAPPGCSARWLRDVIRANPDRFRLFGPDEGASNRLDAVFEVTDRVFAAPSSCPATTTWPATGG